MKEFLFSLKGRIGRTEYIAYVFFLSLFYSIAIFLDYQVTDFGKVVGHKVTCIITPIYSDSLPLFFLLFQLLVSWSNYAVGAKRMHDLGRSGLVMALPVGGLFLFTLVGYIGVGIWLSGAFMLVLSIWRGQKTDNKYGPNPYKYEV